MNLTAFSILEKVAAITGQDSNSKSALTAGLAGATLAATATTAYNHISNDATRASSGRIIRRATHGNRHAESAIKHVHKMHEKRISHNGLKGMAMGMAPVALIAGAKKIKEMRERHASGQGLPHSRSTIYQGY